MKRKIKETTPQLSININQYFDILVHDYHEFSKVVDHFKSAGINVEYEEVDCPGLYYAVFWVGEKPTEYIKCKRLQFEDE